MLISYRWLGRHLDLSGLSAEEVAHDLTIHTAEVEGCERFAPWLDDVVVGKVVECGRHPDADRLSLCRVDHGAEELLQVVCGAPNVAQGQTVSVARVGTFLPTGEDGSLVKLKKGKIRGVESRGMICSVRELQLGDGHDGIWAFECDAPPGTPLSKAMGLEDWVIEIDNKSLTHRPDLWGHRGIAGEIAAIRGRKLHPLDFTPPPTGPGEAYPVRVETENCFRYIGLPIDGVRNGPSPEWLKHLLLAVGQRPLDLLVDLSNFVMLDLGQPNHLFDRDRLGDEGIVVRDARPGEKMATLDEIERELGPEDMLICSGSDPVAIAGVMGGEASKVEPETSRLLLEVASFHPTAVRRTSARLGLRTDASTRFEKFLDPTLPAKACAHLVSLLRELQPEISLPAAAGDAGEWTDPSCKIPLRPGRVREVLGAPIPDGDIERHLTRLGFGVRRGDVFEVLVPSARATKDIGIEEDLIEEVGRMHGYGEIAEEPIHAALAPPPREHRRLLVRRLQDRLSGPARFHEAITHSFQSDDLLGRLGLLEERHVEAVNPVIEGYSKVRRSVLPSLLGLLERNRRHREEIRLFEVGKGYRPEEANERGEPRERHELALVWAAPRPGEKASFDDGAHARLRGVVEDLLLHVGCDAPQWARGGVTDAPPWMHPGKYVTSGAGEAGDFLCRLGDLEPGLLESLGLTDELDCEVAVAQISIDGLLELPREQERFRSIPRFPGSKVDVALALPETVSAGEAVEAIEKAGKGLVERVTLFDLYRGESVGAERKSLAYHVLLQAADKTLTEKEVAKFLGRLERAVEKLGGELRRQ
jgi:phenylalanyl-tRNA synthetase beta chain